MEESKSKEIYGCVAAQARQCDLCDVGDGCRKVIIEGIGHVCLIKSSDLYDKYEGLQEESADMSRDLIKMREKLKGAERACEEKAAELRGQEARNDMLKKDNDYLEGELKKIRERYKNAIDMLNIAREEVVRLRKRNIVARLLNR